MSPWSDYRLRRRLGFGAAALCLLVGSSAAVARAYLCRPDPGVHARVAFCDVVFRGVCQGFKHPEEGRTGTFSRGEPVDFRFVVDHIWWGAAPETLHVFSPGGGSDYGVTFKPGSRYLVFCFLEEGRMLTHPCLGNAEYRDTAPDVQALDALDSLGGSEAKIRFLTDRMLQILETVPSSRHEAALDGLKKLRHAPERSVPAILHAYRYSPITADCSAIEALGSFPSRVDDFLTVLRDALSGGVRCERESALRALEALGPAARPFIPDLRKLRPQCTGATRRRVDLLLNSLLGREGPARAPLRP